MKIHREGTPTILITLVICLMIVIPTAIYQQGWISGTVSLICLVFFIFILSFFRDPDRPVKMLSDATINCPADGKVVVIEEINEMEYFHEKKLLISIFMSPLNVHVNRNPVSGKVDFYQYHPGKYLPAWDPKASTENERTTIVYNTGKHQVLMRQIAGALARRIVCYLKTNDEVTAGEEMGFIKFGSRVDLFLPLGTTVKVKLNQMVKGNIDTIAELS